MAHTFPSTCNQIVTLKLRRIYMKTTAKKSFIARIIEAGFKRQALVNALTTASN